MEIKSLSKIPFSEVLDAFQNAFQDYAVTFDRDAVKAMFERRGFCPDLSFGMFDNGRIVSFLLNGTGMYCGMMTCYDCGTGTLPEYRGKHLVSELIVAAAGELKRAGIKRYILEVIESNSSALTAYQREGFEIASRYLCFNQEIASLHVASDIKLDIEVKDIDVDGIRDLAHFQDFSPSWQNDIESLRRGRAGVIMKAAMYENRWVGYCAADPVTGDIAQIAVDRNFRRRGVATYLLREILKHVTSSTVKVLNVDSECKSLPAFLAALNFRPGLSQFLMSKSL